MLTRKKVVCSILIIFALVLVFTASTVMADNTRIDAVIVDVDGVFVEIELVKYATAYFEGEGNQIYDYLKGSGDFPFVHALRAGDKYVDLEQYANNYFDNVSDAIENSDSLDESEVDQFKYLSGFEEDGSPILVDMVAGFNVSISAAEVVSGQEFNIEITDAFDDDGIILDGVFSVTISTSNADETGDETVIGDVYNIIFQDSVSFTSGSATVPMILNEVDDPQYLQISISPITPKEMVTVTVVSQD